LFLLHRVPAVSIRHPQKAQNVPYWRITAVNFVK
jgi:hypothetical protein